MKWMYLQDDRFLAFLLDKISPEPWIYGRVRYNIPLKFHMAHLKIGNLR